MNNNGFSGRFSMISRLIALLFILMLSLTVCGYSASRTWHSIGGALGMNIVVDPQNPSAIYSWNTSGVYWSPDGGARWSAVRNGLPTMYIRSLVIDPQNPAILYIGGSADVVFKSIDGGLSWTALGNGIGNVSNVLAINPQNPSIMFGGDYGGIFKTTNGGESWNLSKSGILASSPNALAHG